MTEQIIDSLEVQTNIQLETRSGREGDCNWELHSLTKDIDKNEGISMEVMRKTVSDLDERGIQNVTISLMEGDNDSGREGESYRFDMVSGDSVIGRRIAYSRWSDDGSYIRVVVTVPLVEEAYRKKMTKDYLEISQKVLRSYIKEKGDFDSNWRGKQWGGGEFTPWK